MEAKAITKYIRIAPRKMRLVANLIRHKAVAEARAILGNLNKKAARLVEKTLKSAEANAKGKKMEAERLVISDIRADGGPVLKRFMARSMGRADVMLRRMTHLSIVLEEAERSVHPRAPRGTKGKKEQSKSFFRWKKGKQTAGATD